MDRSEGTTTLLDRDAKPDVSGEFMAGGGEVGALIRAHDWAATPLGPIEEWPQSLKTATGLLVASPVPMVMLWGPEGVMIYNDAYSVFAGGRHPWLLGTNVREGWPEVADFNDNVMRVGLAGGTLSYKDQELTLLRHGRPEQVWMNLDYSPVPDETGRPAGVLAVVVETTERVAAERRVTEEAERQRRMLQQMPGFVGMLTGPDLTYTYVNDAYVSISDRTEFIGRPFREVFPDIEGQGFYEVFEGVYRSGQGTVFRGMELRLHGRSEPQYLDYVLEPIRDDAGTVTGVFVGGYETTASYTASAALAESEARYRTLLETTSTGFCILQMKFDEAGRAVDYMILEGNSAFEDLTGLRNATGKWVSEIAPELESHWHEAYGHVALTGEPIRFEQRAEPFDRWYDVQAFRVGEPEAHRVAVLFNDISERKQREQRQAALIALNDALRLADGPAAMALASAEILGPLMRASRVGYGDLNPERGSITIERDWFAEGLASVAGEHRFDAYGRYGSEIMAGQAVRIEDVRTDPRTRDDPSIHEALGTRALMDVPLVESGRVVAQIYVHSATPRVWTEDEVAFVREVAERTRAAVARRAAEEVARHRQIELQRLTDSLPILVSFIDREHRYTLGNKAYHDWFGASADGMVGRHMREVLGEAAYARVLPHVEATLAGETVTYEAFVAYSTGGPRHIRADYVPRRDERGKIDGFYAIVSDISERKEAELRQAVLVEITDAMRDLSDPAALAGAAAGVLGRFLGTDRVGYATINAEAETLVVEQDWTSDRATSLVGTIRLRDWGDFIDPLKQGETLRVEDVRGDPQTARAIHDLESAACRAFVNVPLLEGGDLVAMLFANHADARAWTDHEVSVIQEIAARVRTAVERARAAHAVAENEARLRFLDSLFQATSALTDADAVLAVTTRMTAEHLGVSNCAYADMDDDQDGFNIRGDWATPGSRSIVGRYRLANFGRLAVQELSAGRPLIIKDNLKEIAPEEAATFQAIGVSATICMPLVKDGRLTALMAIHHARPHVWTDAELSLIREVTERSWAHIERVGAEAELRESEARFRNMADQTPMMMWVTDPTGYCTYLNRTWYEFTGQTEQDAIGFGWLDATHPEDRAGAEQTFLKANAAREPLKLDYRLRRADGVYRWAIDAATPRFAGDGSYLGYVGSVVDIDERREIEDALRLTESNLRELNTTLEDRVAERTNELMRAEEALRQSQKMEAIGQLTGGIAHDFNNLLAGISGSLELIEKRMAEGRLAGMERYIQAAQGASRRAATLTQRLLAFSRRQTLDPKPTDVNRLVAGMEDLIRRSVGPDVRVEVEAARDLWATRIDPSQLENALLNLCINSRDAMAPDGGRLTIRTWNVRLDATEARARDLPPGDYVKLSVTDTGTGMTPDVMAKAFDPFFTTKPLGQGTGLGLSMIHGFMRQSGGQVRIETEPGHGTTITLALPRWTGAAAAEDAPVAEALAEEPGQGETVLVIDDEETVRMLVVEVLEDAGYVVLQAADGPAGLAILNSDTRIDLLVSDVGLPGGMNGRQVADAARTARPGLKVLFITGYAENAVVAGDTLEPGMAVMTKPFQVSALAARIREMIEG